MESWLWFNDGGKAIRSTDGTITFGYKFPDDCIYLYGNADGGCSEGTMMIEDGKQYHSDSNINLKYSGTIDLQGKNYLGAKADKYTVVFDENGGSDVDNQIVAHGMKATEPATPTREGYTFKEWKNGEDVYDFNTVVTSDLTLMAKWTENVPTTYTITDVSGTDAQGTLGFYSDETCSTAIAAAAEGATVYVKVTPNSGYQLGSITAERTVGSDGADSRRSESIPKGEPMAVTLVAGTTNVYQLTMPDGNVQVAATFTPIIYSIEYKLFGGTVATANPTEYTVESDAFTLNNPTQEGYTFGGWTGGNGNTPQTEVTIGKGTTGPLNYKAVWYTEATVKVVWDDMNDHDLLRPASVVATLSDGKQVTLNNGNNWTATVENLPAFDADGEAIVYTWTGSAVTNYVQASTEVDGIITLTYSHTPALEFTFATGQTWMTWCGSEAYALPTGLEAYTVSGLSEDGKNVMLELQESILANTPMLLKGTAGETYTATPTAAGTADGLASTTIENVLTFYGNPTDAVITTGGYCVLGKSYVLYKGAFVLVDTDNGIPAHKCLLTLASAVTARLSLVTDDATGIATTPGPSSPEEGKWYDLHGRKLSGEPTKHGIYILNGEKVKK